MSARKEVVSEYDERQKAINNGWQDQYVFSFGWSSNCKPICMSHRHVDLSLTVSQD